MYNFRCRTRIAGGFMIRDYVANQSKDNNKKADSEESAFYISLNRSNEVIVEIRCFQQQRLQQLLQCLERSNRGKGHG